jgi:hypothetical protein
METLCRKDKTVQKQCLVNPMLPLRKQNTRFGDIYASLYNKPSKKTV